MSKKLFILIIVIISLLFACNGKQKESPEKYSNDFLILDFDKDSGYVTKEYGLPFLLANSLTDTLDSFWNQAKDNDTIGKYYNVKKNWKLHLLFH